MGYRGSIYVDTLFVPDDPAYQKFECHLENKDGSLRLPGMKFWALKLDVAMENGHHDEPGFWDKWAENS
ncbi:hypothetical protein [Cupriavidus sp. D39]|uniref:hypothetical protein n=1 Tax=Cupriavidus sp. D39 TaxID=2997877 RepID=UPI00226EA9AA|nr:hypothetical protein [Cupriavidus sp. D39]MCY0854038.1 hypothetical protein [Cupriavidus sp. D39]